MEKTTGPLLKMVAKELLVQPDTKPLNRTEYIKSLWNSFEVDPFIDRILLKIDFNIRSNSIGSLYEFLEEVNWHELGFQEENNLKSFRLWNSIEYCKLIKTDNVLAVGESFYVFLSGKDRSIRYDLELRRKSTHSYFLRILQRGYDFIFQQGSYVLLR